MAELSLVLLLHAFLCASATAVSGYALYVGHSNGRDQDYEAMCDLGPQMSCSSVLTSRRDKKTLPFLAKNNDTFFPTASQVQQGIWAPGRSTRGRPSTEREQRRLWNSILYRGRLAR